MAFQITSACVGCHACRLVCPQLAVVRNGEKMMIAAHRCSECSGEYAEPQCASICPIETAIVDGYGRALNPPGSLTGLVPQPRIVSLCSQGEMG